MLYPLLVEGIRSFRASSRPSDTRELRYSNKDNMRLRPLDMSTGIDLDRLFDIDTTKLRVDTSSISCTLSYRHDGYIIRHNNRGTDRVVPPADEGCMAVK